MQRRHTARYYDETMRLLESFKTEDQEYFNELWDSLVLTGILYDEEAVREQIYNLAVDFSEAQKDYTSAYAYFGMESQELAHQIVVNLPKESMRSFLSLGGIVIAIIIFTRILIHFASQGVLVLSPLEYLADGILTLAMTALIVYIVRKDPESTREGRRRFSWLLGLSLFIYSFLEIVGVRWLPAIAWIPFSSVWSAFIIIIISVGLYLWLSKWKESRIFFIPILGQIITGLIRGWTIRNGLSDPLYTTIIPVVLVIISLIIFYWMTYRLLGKNRK